MDLPFKQYYALQESVEVDINDKERKFLRYLVNNILRNDPPSVIAGNFGRIFGFDPERDEKGWRDNFYYVLRSPRERNFKNPDELKEKISKISGIKNMYHFTTTQELIDVYELLEYLKNYYKEDQDTFYEKGIKIMGLIFNSLAEKFAEMGHQGWSKYYRDKTMSPDSREMFGGMLNAI